ncbi:MAG: tetratricopeptide repeat protein [Myxococcota bacterium]
MPHRIATAVLLTMTGCAPTIATIATPPPPTARDTVAPPARAVAMYLRGQIFLLDEQYSEATAAFEEVLRLDPNRPAVLRALAAAADGRGEPDQRDAYLRRARALEASGAP